MSLKKTARSRHMTALLVSMACADRPIHFTWDSLKYSSAFLSTSDWVMPRLGAKRFIIPDSMVRTPTRRYTLEVPYKDLEKLIFKMVRD